MTGGGRRGVALAAVLFVLLAVAALVAGTFFVALQEFRIGRNSVLARRALDAAEAGLEAALARWGGGSGGLGGLDSAGTLGFDGVLPDGSGSYRGAVQRLNARLFLIRSTGRAGFGEGEPSERTVAIVARLVPPRVEPPAALTVAGQATVGGRALVNGLGEPVGGGKCAGAADTAAGLAVADSALVRLKGCVLGDCVRGSPPVLVDPALGGGGAPGAGVPVLGESGWAGLRTLADTTLAPTAAVAANPAWPEVVRAAGDLHLEGGRGRGVLLVEGDLLLSGGAVWEGLVAVRGTLKTQDAGGVVRGAALAGAAELGGGGAEGVEVARSACLVRRALEAAAPLRALGERGWGELFKAGT